MKFLLRIRHFQLFILIFVISLIGDVASRLTNLLAAEVNPAIDRVYGLISAVGTLLAMLWIDSIVTYFRRYVPQGINVNINTFKTCIYSIILIDLLNNVIFHNNELFQRHLFVWSLSWVAFLCFLYAIYEAANTLTSVENQEPAKFKTLALTILGFAFFPIGLWFIQPRVNAIFNK